MSIEDMASKDESKIIADYQKLFAQIIGDYKCTICQGLGHSKRFHELCPELRRQHKLAFNIISPPAAALPPSPAALPRPRSSPNLGLGPHAQSQSKPKSSWLDYISENEERWPKNHLQSLLTLRQQKIFVISKFCEMTALWEQFEDDYMFQRVSGFDLERQGLSHAGAPTEQEKKDKVADKIVCLQIAFPNGHVYFINLKALGKMPYEVGLYFRTNQLIKIGCDIERDLIQLRDQYNQSVWSAVDIRFVYLHWSPLDYKSMQNGLKKASMIVLGRDMTAFEYAKWALMVKERKWPKDLVNYSCEDALISVAITLTCAALKAPANVLDKDQLNEFTYQSLLKYVDVGLSATDLNEALAAMDSTVLSLEMSSAERAKRRAHRRDVFYKDFPLLAYPHNLTHTTNQDWRRHPHYQRNAAFFVKKK